MGYILPVDNITARNDVNKLVNRKRNVFKISKAEKIQTKKKDMNLNNDWSKESYKTVYTRDLINDNNDAIITRKGLLYNEKV